MIPKNGAPVNPAQLQQVLCPCGKGDFEVVTVAMIHRDRLERKKLIVTPGQGFRCFHCGQLFNPNQPEGLVNE